MRYWVVVKDKVAGPYPPEELARLPSFSARSAVCPEERRGNRTEDWEQAGECTDLAALLEPRPRLPLRASEQNESAESVLRQFAAHGNLLDKIAAANSAITRLKQELSERDVDMEALRRHASEQSLAAARFMQKASDMEGSMAEANHLRAELARALADKKLAESASDLQQLLVNELNDKIAGLKKNENLAEKIEALATMSARLEQGLAKTAAELAGLREAAARAAEFESELKAKAELLAIETTRSEVRHGLIKKLAEELSMLKEERDRARSAPPPPPRT